MEEQIEAVQRMQDYIENHMTGKITLSRLAEVSFFSPWYTYRLFVQHVGMTPADYIRRLRLSKSALRLWDEPAKIVTTCSNPLESNTECQEGRAK